MKGERLPLESKTSQTRFQELGSKLLSVPKEEIDARDRKWHSEKSRARKRKRR